MTPAEAAVLAGVTVRDINRVIDERILPTGLYRMAGGRRLRVTACPLIGFYFHAANALTAEERAILIRRVGERLIDAVAGKSVARQRKGRSRSIDWTVHDRFLTVDLSEFAAGVHGRQAKLASARDIVVQDAEILSGTPVIRGTRIPIYDVAASVANGFPPSRIRSAYPGLTDELIELAAIYAEAHPPRGRPPRSQSLLSGAKVLATGGASRRRSA